MNSETGFSCCDCPPLLKDLSVGVMGADSHSPGSDQKCIQMWIWSWIKSELIKPSENLPKLKFSCEILWVSLKTGILLQKMQHWKIFTQCEAWCCLQINIFYWGSTALFTYMFWTDPLKTHMNRTTDHSKKNLFQCSYQHLSVVLRHTWKTVSVVWTPTGLKHQVWTDVLWCIYYVRFSDLSWVLLEVLLIMV